jgi:hypothetical protein
VRVLNRGDQGDIHHREVETESIGDFPTAVLFHEHVEPSIEPWNETDALIARYLGSQPPQSFRRPVRQDIAKGYRPVLDPCADLGVIEKLLIFTQRYLVSLYQEITHRSLLPRETLVAKTLSQCAGEM